MIWDFMTKPLQGALLRKFKDQIMDVIPDQDVGLGKYQPGKARNIFLKLGPAGRAAPQECVQRS